MPAFKGNRGHLMQHWPLCEMLGVAARKGVTGLNFIDAYAMAPLATEYGFKDAKFKSAENSLPNLGDSASAYEKAWYKLTSGHHPVPREGYPNSAAFVEQVWKGNFSMSLCEIDEPTIDEIKPWLQCVDKLARCKRAKLFCGDWRHRFKCALRRPTDVGLEGGALTLVLFDPYICSSHKNATKKDSGNIYIEDIEKVMRDMPALDGGILIQLSTYSAMNNPHKAVILSTHQVLAANGFRLLAVVRLNGHMMSMVYGHNVPWAAELADLGDRFDKWLFAFWPRRKVKPLGLDWTKL